MKYLIKVLFIAILFVGCKTDKKIEKDASHQNHETVKSELSKKKVLSPHTSTMIMIGDAHVHVD